MTIYADINELVDALQEETSTLRNENIAIRDRLVAIEIALDALTERIAALTDEPVSPHEDTLVATDQLKPGDIIRWSSGEYTQWRTFHRFERHSDGCWYAYMKDGI